MSGENDVFSTTTIGQIISRDYRKSQALVNRGVDYSCGGHRTLAQVFRGKEDDLLQVLEEWTSLDQQPAKKGMDYPSWDLAFLTNYIIQLHHRFVSSQTRFITELAFKVADANFSRNPEIRQVAKLFNNAGHQLDHKGQTEEARLFPYIVSLQEAVIHGTRLKPEQMEPMAIPISTIRKTGEQIIADLAGIRSLTNQFRSPPYTTSTCPILYKLLAAYEADTLLHLHLEHNILFPRALRAEEALRQNQQII